MSVNKDVIVGLAEPTPTEEVRQRPGPGGRTLDYIDARFVMDRLDFVVGAENWQDRYEDREDTGATGFASVRGGIGINIDGEWVWKWDVGTPTDIEPEKGSYSEAFKRAGVKWGIGRDLYSHTSQVGGRTSSPARPTAVARQEFGASAPAAAAEPEPVWDAGTVGTECPIHHKPYRTNQRGMFCANKLDDGSWCKEPRRAA